MNRETVDAKIAEVAKTVFSFCYSHTSSKEEAEDLSQNILLEILKSHGNIRDDNAFYGFMWAVAGNVYKNWCKKRSKRDFLELNENAPDDNISMDEQLENETDLALLRRELCLLSEKHRKATILYYFNGMSVSEISKSLCLSESMAKYLLFKARQILKEGMNMERTYGDLSYNPKNMSLHFWGSGGNCFWQLCNDNMIAQNILLACYNDNCNAQEISLQIGVPIPYLEKDLAKLCEYGVLKKIGEKYATNVVIFTKDFSMEADVKTLPVQKEIAECIGKFLDENEATIRGIGFYGNDMSKNLYKWHITGIILEKAVFGKFQSSLNIKYPKTIFGDEAFVLGEEDYLNTYGDFGTCGLTNKAGDLIRFLDYSMNGDMLHHYFYNYQNHTNTILDVANGNTDNFSENDLEVIAGFIKKGIARKENNKILLNIPVFKMAQFEKLLEILDPVTSLVAEKTAGITKTATQILVQHTPTYLKEEAKNIGWLKMFDSAVAAPVKIMLDNGYIFTVGQTEIPTAYITLIK